MNFPKWMGAVPRGGYTWTPEEEAELLEKFRAGYSVAMLAKRHGRTETGIAERLMRVLGDNWLSHRSRDKEHLIGAVESVIDEMQEQHEKAMEDLANFADELRGVSRPRQAKFVAEPFIDDDIKP